MSGSITLNGRRVTKASVTIPYYGAWSADVELEGAADLVAPLALTIGSLVLRGAVVRSHAFAGVQRVRMVGGAAGWRKALGPKGYSQPSGVKLSAVLADAARETGETVTVGSDRILGEFWTREAAPAQHLLELLADGVWYIDAQGVTQVRERATSAIATPFTVARWDGARGVFDIATEAYQDWTPGRTFSTNTVPVPQTISSVGIEAGNDGTVRLAVTTVDTYRERLLADLRAIVRAEVSALTFAGEWEYTIASGTDETVDVVSGHPKLPDITRVPMRPGLLGEQVLPTPGSKCRLVFVNADPARPECIGIVGTPLLSTLSGGIMGVARMGDPVIAGPFSGTVVSGSTKVRCG